MIALKFFYGLQSLTGKYSGLQGLGLQCAYTTMAKNVFLITCWIISPQRTKKYSLKRHNKSTFFAQTCTITLSTLLYCVSKKKLHVLQLITLSNFRKALSLSKAVIFHHFSSLLTNLSFQIGHQLLHKKGPSCTTLLLVLSLSAFSSNFDAADC